MKSNHLKFLPLVLIRLVGIFLFFSLNNDTVFFQFEGVACYCRNLCDARVNVGSGRKFASRQIAQDPRNSAHPQIHRLNMQFSAAGRPFWAKIGPIIGEKLGPGPPKFPYGQVGWAPPSGKIVYSHTRN